MADTKNQPQVILTGDQFARQQLAAEMAELAKSPLDKTVPGGRYQGTDGKLHDAEGQKLEDEDGDEEDTGPLSGVNFASDEAGELAVESGLTAADFEGVSASGSSGGFTKGDVQKVADAKAAP
jgi:hypothetical protein